MKAGNKYQPLFNLLQNSERLELTLTLQEIETVLRDSLPDSAHRVKGWWSNRERGGLQSHSWLDAGYHVGKVYPDSLICSGLLPQELNGQPCTGRRLAREG